MELEIDKIIVVGDSYRQTRKLISDLAKKSVHLKIKSVGKEDTWSGVTELIGETGYFKASSEYEYIFVTDKQIIRQIGNSMSYNSHFIFSNVTFEVC